MVSREWLKRHIKDFDFLMLLVLLAISAISTVAVYSTTVHRPGMEDWYVKEVAWQIVSYIGTLFFAILDYEMFRNRVAWIGYGISLFLLVIVFAFPAVKGAHSWILLPGFQFQPSEFAKIFVILTIADYMAKIRQQQTAFGWKQFGTVLLIAGVPLVLIVKQPALGQALVLIGILFSMTVLFVSRRQLILLAIAGGLLGTAVILGTAVFPDQTLKLIHNLPLAEHQKERIVTFLDPEADPTGIGYQVMQAKIAVGAGQLFGKGLLHGSQTEGAWVPEQWTDFIFSAIAEQFGFVGSSCLILLFFVFLYRMILVASTAPDDFSVYFIAGAFGMFAFQIFENIGMNLTIMPVAGITLPFVSYGGSSLLTNFSVVGIVLSIALRRRKLAF
ncbi:rod shape-determining protein RodA [Effusibacillus pohliae]|uniref:rod shape-determining protein RodA n=1 Tax=Effusibacillus pohliae TaxID=232270 RepID=UPI00036CD2FB|nr:rod shape-determining protein RodA [Effusibacillus pohliae]